MISANQKKKKKSISYPETSVLSRRDEDRHVCNISYKLRKTRGKGEEYLEMSAELVKASSVNGWSGKREQKLTGE